VRDAQLTCDQTEVAEAVRRMIFNVRAANAADHGKNHSFPFDEGARQWTLSPAYDPTDVQLDSPCQSTRLKWE
jgi:serine/threonine-protein kinase HipA